MQFAESVRTLRLEFADAKEGEAFQFKTGQFGPLQCLWRRREHLLHRQLAHAQIALPPLRSVIWNCLDLRDWFKDITVVYGARAVNDIVYKHALDAWGKRTDMKLVTTVDPGGEKPGWTGKVGFVPHIVEQLAPAAADTVPIVCGPPIMIKLTLPVLTMLGFGKNEICTTLENRMTCGLGKRGRCNTDRSYVCKDGPVYTLAELEKGAGRILTGRARRAHLEASDRFRV